MKEGTAQKISNAILSCAAGFASFVFSLAALLYLREFDQKILASLAAGAFCLLVSYVASERPNSESARRSGCPQRPLARGRGRRSGVAGTHSVRRVMPKLAAAVDCLFAEVRASIENAHALGMYDPVTSLPNRLHFRSEADKLLSEALEGTSSAMLFVDLDRFKMVNDSLGHARGDQLLIMVANRLRVVVNAEFNGKHPHATASSHDLRATSSRCSSRKSPQPTISSGSQGALSSPSPSRSSSAPTASTSAHRSGLRSPRITARASRR